MDWYLIYSMRYQNWMLNYKKSSSKFVIKKFFLVYLVFFNINANALNGYVSIDHSATDKDWSFLPEVTNSFDYSDFSSLELMLVQNNIGLKFNIGEFYLNLERPVQPKSLALNAESQLYEFFYILDSDKSISLTFKNQTSDTQQIECYTFSSLTIGFCDEAVLSITNSKEKYDVLEDNKLMLLDAANKEIKFSYTQAVDTFFSDEYVLYLAISKNEFDWLSPIEELTGGFIANLSYKGTRIGDLVTNEIKRLPQRDAFELYKLGLNLYKNINIFKNVYLFYDFDVVFVETKDYIIYNNVNNHNIKFETGLNFKIDDLAFSLSGTLYQNNLFGYEDISFNQRSEHHFSSNFGTLNIKLRYSF